MYKTLEEAKAAALKVIEEKMGGEKCGCCVTESKLTSRSRKTSFNFRFFSEDSGGKFLMNEDGSYSKLTAI